MEYMVLIVAALFLITVFERTLWKPQHLSQRSARTRRLAPRTAPMRHLCFPASGTRSVWRRQPARPHMTAEPRWWWE